MSNRPKIGTTASGQRGFIHDEKGTVYVQYCQRCGKYLEPEDIVMIEWDTRTGPTFEPVPPEYSQGWFPYGKACARRLKLASRAKEAFVKSVT